MHKSADWISWALHLVLGLIVGGVLALYLAMRIFRNTIGSSSLLLPFIIGTVLLMGGLGSLYGDKLWMGGRYRLIQPDGPAHSALSKGISIWLCVFGCVIAGYGLYTGLAGL